MSGKNKPKVHVGVVEKVKEMVGCSDRRKNLKNFSLDLETCIY